MDDKKQFQEFEEINVSEVIKETEETEEVPELPKEEKKEKKAKEKKPLSSKNMKIIAVAAVVAIALGIFLGVKLIHTCDDCGKLFFGTGYVGTGLNQLVKTDYVCCRDCAEKKHAWDISLFGGKHSIDEFKKPFFGSSDKELSNPTTEKEKE